MNGSHPITRLAQTNRRPVRHVNFVMVEYQLPAK